MDRVVQIKRIALKSEPGDWNCHCSICMSADHIYGEDNSTFQLYKPFADSAKALKVGQLVVLEEIQGGYKIKDDNNKT